MKPNHLFIILFITLYTVNLKSQTNDRIKQESEQNRQERSNSGSGSSEGGNDSYDSESTSDLTSSLADGCTSGCINGGCLVFVDVMGNIFKGLSDANVNILLKEPEVPRINSFELGLNAGFINPNSTLLMPSVKLRGGLLSTSLRVFSNTENHLPGKNNYSTVNWQIIQFNLATERNFNVSIGTGILFETHSGEIFNEFGFGAEFFPGKFYIPLEFRYTPDYTTGTRVLFEAQTGLGYTVGHWQNTALRFQVNYTFGNYYEAVDVHGFSAGFTFLFDTGDSRVN